jgi:hypothetical protein
MMFWSQQLRYRPNWQTLDWQELETQQWPQLLCDGTPLHCSTLADHMITICFLQEDMKPLLLTDCVPAVYLTTAAAAAAAAAVALSV